ncbi:MAG: Serine phosphatase RsbU, regulator of sigma subunit [uncultured Acidimicrobiales bacterium]|uniref:Serine phosphatase RsbU, regulator of sigma subunit n=1 Tax=uncultured Acidimicrobiales bacterium TaxID=310071 RepID=A0A6J4HEC6_9ACTN|nr:MAG: Serine phosphatase RsbU, regulator of sigma subunit [uncultured Acidimicrobiales bacterium]
MPPLSLGRALRIAQGADPAAIPDIVLRIAGEFGATDVVVYLVDFAQTTLEPLPDRSTHTEVPKSEEVATTMAGRAFVDQRATSVQRPEGVRLWVPIVEGSDRTGVLAVTVADADDDIVRACEDLGVFAGYLIATQARATDIYNLHRRRRSLSLAASMQWDLLPPLVLRTERMTVAALIEPAYEVGGDCFDYALNETVLDLGVFDPVGHGMASALIAALNVGAYRHDRRRGQSLEQMHAHLDETMRAQFRDLSFATGQLVRVDMGSGEMTWTNAGHPLPLLLRGGKVIDELRCPPSLPWGLGGLEGSAAPTPVATAALEPGDSVLFYTDGVVEAHLPGQEEFGVERLVDLVGQHASDQLEPEEIVRRLVRSVLDYQDDRLTDDATLVLFKWNGPPG